jgi:hypothetical protein
MAKASQFCVPLDNKPGQLAKLCGALKRAKVNIDGIAVADNVDGAWVRLVASPVANARKALTKGKYHFSTQRVLSVPSANKPGELEAVAAKLTKAGININYVYAAASKAGKMSLVLGVDNVDKAAKAVG